LRTVATETHGHLEVITMETSYMSAATIVSVQDYLHRTEKPYCEYVDGVLHPKAMPTKLHALVQYLLITLLRKQGIEASFGGDCPIKSHKIPDTRCGGRVHIAEPVPNRAGSPLRGNTFSRGPCWRVACQMRGVPRVGRTLLLGGRSGKANRLAISVRRRARAFGPRRHAYCGSAQRSAGRIIP
jgi:hypothetical protein